MAPGIEKINHYCSMKMGWLPGQHFLRLHWGWP